MSAPYLLQNAVRVWLCFDLVFLKFLGNASITRSLTTAVSSRIFFQNLCLWKLSYPLNCNQPTFLKQRLPILPCFIFYWKPSLIQNQPLLLNLDCTRGWLRNIRYLLGSFKPLFFFYHSIQIWVGRWSSTGLAINSKYLFQPQRFENSCLKYLSPRLVMHSENFLMFLWIKDILRSVSMRQFSYSTVA